MLGDPAYYGRNGFRAASEYGITSPDPAWGSYFQARPLGAGPVPAGLFSYATPFHGL
jgi:putative acetyltransferase